MYHLTTGLKFFLEESVQEDVSKRKFQKVMFNPAVMHNGKEVYGRIYAASPIQEEKLQGLNEFMYTAKVTGFSNSQANTYITLNFHTLEEEDFDFGDLLEPSTDVFIDFLEKEMSEGAVKAAEERGCAWCQTKGFDGSSSWIDQDEHICGQCSDDDLLATAGAV